MKICLSQQNPLSRPRFFFSNCFRLLFLITLTLFISCQAQGPVADFVENQIDLRNGWVDSLHQLSQRNRNMWDSTNAELADALPPTMNSEERNNILGVRNADLINMFEVYPSFEANLKEQIVAAGRQDKKDAMMISKLMHQIDSIEKVIGKNIEMISDKDPALGKRLLDTLSLANTLNH